MTIPGFPRHPLLSLSIHPFGYTLATVPTIAWFLRHAPVFPIMGDGQYRLQCGDLDDVAEVAAHAADGTGNMVAELVEPEIFTYEGLVRLVAERVRSRARIIRLPVGVVQPLLAVAGLVVRDVIVTRDEITGLMSDLLVARGAPAGRRRFRDWLDEHAPDLGRTYASELRRHLPVIHRMHRASSYVIMERAAGPRSRGRPETLFRGEHLLFRAFSAEQNR